MPILRRNPLFSNKARRSRTLQVVIIIIVFIGLFFGVKALFFKSSKITNHLKTAKNSILKGNYDTGLDELNKALAIDPENALTYDGFGYLYVHKGEVDKAKEFYTKAEEKKAESLAVKEQIEKKEEKLLEEEKSIIEEEKELEKEKDGGAPAEKEVWEAVKEEEEKGKAPKTINQTDPESALMRSV